MKHSTASKFRLWLAALLTLTYFVGNLHAQQMIVDPSQSQPTVNGVKLVRANVFPLGGLDLDPNISKDSLTPLYMNFASYFLGGGPFFSNNASNSIAGVGGGSDFLWEYAGYNEWRGYYFSGYKRDTDRVFDYGVHTDPHGGHVPYPFALSALHAPDSASLEPYSTANAADTLSKINYDNSDSGYSGNYVLRQSNHVTALYNGIWNDDSQRVLYDTSRLAHFVDFMYRFEDNALDPYSPTEPIYTVEVWVRARKSSALYGSDRWKLWDTVLSFPITKNSYNAVNWQWDSSDLEHGLRNPLWNGASKYKRMHCVLDSQLMIQMYLWGYDPAKHLTCLLKGDTAYSWLGTSNSFQDQVLIDVRVRRNHDVKMFVKGIRMREQGAERLLTGQLDGKLGVQFEHIKFNHYIFDSAGVRYYRTTSPTYYNRLLNIQATNPEPYPDKFYIIGYLDRFTREHGYKRIADWGPMYPRECRLIWDDILWTANPKYKNDMAPQHIWRNIEPCGDGRDGGCPLPIDAMQKDKVWGLDLIAQSLALRNEVRTFEKYFDTTILSRFRGGLFEANQAAFSFGSKPVHSG